MKRLALLGIGLTAGCSSQEKPALQPVTEAVGQAATTGRHPLAKYLELAGFRLKEILPGKLEVKFAAINHSYADLGDMTVKVRIKTSKSAPDDPPVTEFEARIPNFGPLETKDITAVADTRLRVYELPDWQFVRAEFEITYPQP